MQNATQVIVIPDTVPTAATCPYCDEPIVGASLSLSRMGYGVRVHQDCYITAVTAQVKAPVVTPSPSWH